VTIGLFRHWVAGMVLALAASVAGGGQANAAVVTFNEVHAFECSFNTSMNHGGMTFSSTWSTCYYAPEDPADFPTPITSSVMAVGYGDLLMTRDDSSAFTLNSVDLAFGPFEHGGLLTDTTTVTGFFAGGGSISSQFTVGYGFQTFNFGPAWTNLASVTFGALETNRTLDIFTDNSQYLGLDNITYDGAAVPEPGVWAMMLLGFGGMGALLRRSRRQIRAAAA